MSHAFAKQREIEDGVVRNLPRDGVAMTMMRTEGLVILGVQGPEVHTVRATTNILTMRKKEERTITM